MFKGNWVLNSHNFEAVLGTEINLDLAVMRSHFPCDYAVMSHFLVDRSACLCGYRLCSYVSIHVVRCYLIIFKGWLHSTQKHCICSLFDLCCSCGKIIGTFLN